MAQTVKYDVQYLDEDLNWVTYSSHEDREVARLVMKRQMRGNGDPWRLVLREVDETIESGSQKQ